MSTEDNSSSKSFPIAGIGASAGGLDAFKRFLTELPQEFGFAVVFIQHLLAKQKSLLPGLLRSKKPDIEINEISEGLEILPGKIYLSPPGKEIRIQNGKFVVAARREEHLCLPIDDFFESLAEELGERAIAVIFSGDGTDGARGIQSIRMTGGAVFVQDPATAEFTGMPDAAIGTGQVDGVLPPEDIAREILKMQDAEAASVSNGGHISPAALQNFYRLIREKTGYSFDHYKKSVVSRRIKRRMYLHGISTVKEYSDLLVNKDSEAPQLAADLMIGVTSFFRDRLAWKALRMGAIRKLATEDKDYPVRVWTPACATGEEAYSIAMMLHDEFQLAGRKREIQVFATDVNDAVLEKAREGKYPGSIAADVTPDYIRKYFTRSEDGLSVTVIKAIREHVVFAKQDLLTDPPFSRLDLIICRNLLIYLEPDAQEKCVALFHYALKEDGYLFLGDAESVGRGKTLFKSLPHKKCRIYQKIGTKPPSRLQLAVPFAAERASTPSAKQSSAEEGRQSISGLAQETLLEEYAPASVAINQNYDILYHNGPTSRYLRQPRGAPTQNLLELLPENLRSRVRGAIYRASRENKPVSIRTSIAGDGERKRQVTLRISKLKENFFIIVFREKGIAFEQSGAVSLEATGADEIAVRQLENELSATRADLQSHIEQLKSLNEELQSSNEELQAANEELETSREELQSLNEELITVNSQLQSKIEEQEETNNDLNNFLSSTNMPTIFLDPQFRVKRFTPAMSKLIKLIPSDLGRPIIDMSQEGLGPDLIVDARSVLDNLVPVKKGIAINGTWYVRATLPYRTFDNRIEGVIVTYNDITELKRAEEQTRHLASFPQLNPNPVMEVGLSGEIIFCNPATQRILEDLGMDKGDAKSFLPPDLGDIVKTWDTQNELILYRETKVKDRVYGGTVYLTPQFDVARIYFIDITERRRMEEKLIHAKEEWERTFDSVPDMIAILDNQHRIMRVNQSMARRLGLKPADCIGLPCYKAVHGTSVPPAFCPHSRTVADHREHIQEVHEERLGGDFLVSATPLYDEQGQMTGSVHVAHDITQRKKAEEALKKAHNELEMRVRERTAELAKANEELEIEIGERKRAEEIAKTERQRLYDVLETLPAMICLLTPDYHVAFANRSFRERFGESGGRHCYDYCFGRKEPCDFCESFKVLETGKPHHWEVAAPDGSVIEAFDFPFTDVDGSPMILEMDMDITAFRKAERSLKELNETLEQHVTERTAELVESEEQFRRAIEDAPIPVIMHAEDGHVLQISRTWTRLTGYTPEDMPTFEAWLNRAYGKGADLVRKHMQELFSGNQISIGIEFPILTRDGLTRHWSFNASAPGTLRDGRRFIIGMAVDITERKQAEEELRKLTEELKRSNADLQQFAYIASHDLQSPLRNIEGFAKMLVRRYKGQIDEKADEFIHFISTGVKDMQILILDILEYSKVGSDGGAFKMVDSSLCVAKAISNLDEAITEKKADITVDEPFPTVFGDSVQLTSLFQNLIGNAIKFCTETPKIRLSAKKEGAEYIFSVMDNGISINPEDSDKIFAVFHRLHSKSEYPGTGIGLAICSKIVERHKGRIWVESEPGKGSTFYFTLPIMK